MGHESPTHSAQASPHVVQRKGLPFSPLDQESAAQAQAPKLGHSVHQAKSPMISYKAKLFDTG